MSSPSSRAPGCREGLAILLLLTLAGCPTSGPTGDDDDTGPGPTSDADLRIEVYESRAPGSDEAVAYASAGLPYERESWWVESETAGDCTYFAAVPPEPCDPPCDYPDTCNDDGECESPPDAPNAGTITVEGLSVALSIEPEPPYDYYLPTFSPDPPGGDLFDEGDPIGASAAGGDIPTFTLETTGVADLVTDLDCPPPIAEGEPLTVTWTPGTQGDSMRFHLRSGNHGTQFSTLVCDTADDGELIVDAALLSTWLADFHPVNLWLLQRSSASTTESGAATVEFEVSTRVSCMY